MIARYVYATRGKRGMFYLLDYFSYGLAFVFLFFCAVVYFVVSVYLVWFGFVIGQCACYL